MVAKTSGDTPTGAQELGTSDRARNVIPDCCDDRHCDCCHDYHDRRDPICLGFLHRGDVPDHYDGNCRDRSCRGCDRVHRDPIPEPRIRGDYHVGPIYVKEIVSLLSS